MSVRFTSREVVLLASVMVCLGVLGALEGFFLIGRMMVVSLALFE